MPIISIKILIKSFEASTLKSTQAAIEKVCLLLTGEKRSKPLTYSSNTYPMHYETGQAPLQILPVNPQHPSPLTPPLGPSQDRRHGLSSRLDLMGTFSRPSRQPVRLKIPSRESFHEVALMGKSSISCVALPVSRKSFTLLRSPHIDKKSREQFQIQTYRCRIDLSLQCKGKASLLLFILRNSEFPGTQLRIEATYSTPYSQ